MCLFFAAAARSGLYAMLHLQQPTGHAQRVSCQSRAIYNRFRCDLKGGKPRPPVLLGQSILRMGRSTLVLLELALLVSAIAATAIKKVHVVFSNHLVGRTGLPLSF